jgi:hypothetical protein
MNTMLLIALITGLLIAGTFWFTTSPSSRWFSPLRPMHKPDLAPLVQALRELAELSTMEVNLLVPVTTTLQGRLGSSSVALLAHATARLGVDLEHARITVTTSSSTNSVTISLPPAQLLGVTLDPDRTQVVAQQRSGLWCVTPGHAREAELLLTAQQQATAAAHAAVTPAHLATARARVEQLLHDAAGRLGWAVVVEDPP